MSTSDKADRSLKPYWYPMFDNEENEVLPYLKANVKRSGINTIIIDFIVKLLGVIFVASIVFVGSKQLYGLYDLSFPIFSQQNAKALCISASIFSILFIVMIYFIAKKEPSVYLVGFCTAKPPEELATTNEQFQKFTEDIKRFNPKSLDFLSRLIHRTGLGDHTYLPPAFHTVPPDDTYKSSRYEMEINIKIACDELFNKLKIDPQKDIDFVITNCSMFAPTPSLSAMIMNIYKMKETCKNYSLGGMGCSAGLISIDLARDLLRCNKNINILVYSTECITRGWYPGQEKGRLLSDTLFRMGGAAILLSNKSKYSSTAPYKLVTSVRINHQKYDDSYNCIFQSEDDDGIVGVKIGRDLLKCVTRALVQNLNQLMPVVMSWKDIFLYLIDMIQHKLNMKKKEDIFKPNFRETFQGFCIHAGGRAIIDGLQENLNLTDEDCMPSRAALYRFGNTSSSSIWYEFKFIERIHTLQKGDKVWQIGFGSGLKCNSVVWKKIN
ncbi:3-ketoacyl-CoA synthase, putative [Entamoeba dispar SAW760]|uniref:3-ketoacyl-CoA synthase n=1 Tax=Entamoeba dispar (strain ATCC PRA-260 / SAW760) TaxID=370354 RepID=B0EF12_ENTDS|nr:3-ketoacyl-CoA synthase, putative [Entamoeba dispar SAW760]EDR26861.1 3-ketoacyl-CoA synthase, putative [Entamoeba dispar SAW760]|eukprot:EDR26861.1 3-ketoacyl-CoA synthase, putative [Entamoeba dispar SAW760]